MRAWQLLTQVGASLSVTLALLALPGTSPVSDRTIPMRSAVDVIPPPVVPPPRPPAPIRHTVVALGDSVPSGASCGCTPYPGIYATLLGRVARAPATVTNEAVGGQHIADVAAQLGQSAIAAAVRRADVVLVTVGANDLEDHESAVLDGSCGAACIATDLARLRAQLGTVLARIAALRASQPTTILVTGYWNVFQDGPVAQTTYGTAGVRTALALTHSVNAAIAASAAASGAHYVDLFTPFHSGGTVSRYLASDGDHPDAAGHALIARTLVAAGLPRLPR